VTQLAQGRYELRSTLGSGGMATVYRAWDTMLHVERAIKVLEPRLTKSETLRTRFLNEARTMARLSHPAIVPVVDLGVDGQHTFLVMELVDGGSLHDLLAREGALPPQRAGELVLGVLEGLRVAHAAGIVHRDIKPQNILLTSDGQPRLSDFGIAHVSDATRQLTRTGSVMGTVGFMAPEQRISARRVDARADIYAMGTTLFAALTGEMPIELYASAFDEELLAGIPGPLVPVIQRSTAYKPEQRYAEAPEMAEALRRALELVPEGTPALRRTAATSGATISLEDEPLAHEPVSQPTLFQDGLLAPISEVEAEPVEDLLEPEPSARRRRGPLVGLVVLLLVGGVAGLATQLGPDPVEPAPTDEPEEVQDLEAEPVAEEALVAPVEPRPKLAKQIEGPAEPAVAPEPPAQAAAQPAASAGAGLSGRWSGSLNRGSLELDLVFDAGGEVAGSAGYNISGFQVNTPVRGDYSVDGSGVGEITLHGQRSGGRVLLQGAIRGDSMSGSGQIGPRDATWSVGKR
jgi:tRNA A-37 threonylcarbamoyl transferase component Bud32